MADTTNASKRPRSEEEEEETAFSTLAVFSYRTPVATAFFPHGEAAENTTHMVLRCLFGPRAHNMFSFTISAEGRFFCVDEQLIGLLDRSQSELARVLWHCLYIHEASEEKKGTETYGTMAALSRKLAAEEIAVLDCSTLTRNFMLVRLDNAERALRSLQDAIGKAEAAVGRNGSGSDGGGGGGGGSGGGGATPVPGTVRAAGDALAAAQLALLPGEVTIARLSLDALPACSHALLQLLFFPPGKGTGTGTAAAPPSPAFLHYFEMGGEVSLMAEQTALDALTGLDSDESGRALRSAITPTASAGWRVIRVTCTAGSDAVGILSAVCRPLAALPLMNVSTLDANFLLVEGRHLEAALELLRQAGSTVARLL